ncbi:MAG: hypothetical protein K0Q55_1618 [Verrucomicrobia bacterium]|jgi:hypothetical protein|nr:hypothetical protein [Verrucomicrobiota bacterium]
MPKWMKFLIALLLIPFCIGTTQALWRVIQAAGASQNFWVAFFAGVLCWIVVFLLLPRPMWLYVVGHEMTHAIWTWVFGGRVKKMKVTSKGGHVIITKSNFVISLAPYFFPFYAFLLLVVFGTGHLIWDWSKYWVVFHLFLGMAYAFHVTLTIHVLQTEQSDITEHGYLFSIVIIYLGNVLLPLLSLPLLTENMGLARAIGLCFRLTGDVFVKISLLI